MINIICSFFGIDGYSSHSRQLANALAKQTKVRVTAALPNGWERNATDREVEMIKQKPEEDEINLIITLPSQWKLHTKNGRNWAYCVWEGDKVPESFIPELLNPDIEYIFVPSEHTKQAILKTTDNKIISNKIKIIPHGVDLDKFYPKEKPEKFSFVCNKGFKNMEDRGGIQYFLKAYLAEFTKDDNVEAVLRINPAYPMADLNKVLIDLGANDNSPKINIINQPLEYEKLVEVYNKGHVFVSPSRSDAFNIPCLEAMACGLPVITTTFGGQADFCTNETGWMFGGKLEEVKRTMEDYMYEGIRWLSPSIEELQNRLRVSFDQRNILDKKIEKALETARKMTWDNSAKEVLKCLGPTKDQ